MGDVSLEERKVPAGNTSTGILKLIALLLMVVDHVGAVIFPKVPELRYIGRAAYPIYCWCMIVGFHYTRNAPKYMMRVLFAGLFVQPLYSVTMLHGWSDNHFAALGKELISMASGKGLTEFIGELLKIIYVKPSVFFTLFLGLFALWGIREKRLLSQWWAPALAMLAANIMGADYGWKGVLLFILLYAVRDSRPGLTAVMVAFFMYWGSFFATTQRLFGLRLNFSDLPQWFSQILTPFFRTEAYALWGLPLILIRFKKNWKMPLWLSYAIYPAHLVILLLVQQWIH